MMTHFFYYCPKGQLEFASIFLQFWVVLAFISIQAGRQQKRISEGFFNAEGNSAYLGAKKMVLLLKL